MIEIQILDRKNDYMVATKIDLQTVNEIFDTDQGKMDFLEHMLESLKQVYANEKKTKIILDGEA